MNFTCENITQKITNNRLRKSRNKLVTKLVLNFCSMENMAFYKCWSLSGISTLLNSNEIQRKRSHNHNHWHRYSPVTKH